MLYQHLPPLSVVTLFALSWMVHARPSHVFSSFSERNDTQSAANAVNMIEATIIAIGGPEALNSIGRLHYEAAK